MLVLLGWVEFDEIEYLCQLRSNNRKVVVGFEVRTEKDFGENYQGNLVVRGLIFQNFANFDGMNCGFGLIAISENFVKKGDSTVTLYSVVFASIFDFSFRQSFLTH